MTTADPVEAVLFDIDDTLCTYRRSVPEMLDTAFNQAGVEPFFEAKDYFDAYDRHADEADNMVELRERCFAELAERAGRPPDVGRTVADIYATERDHTNVRPLPGAIETVELLRDEHDYHVGAVTNGAPEMQIQKLAALDLADAFETVIYAGYDAPAKPSPEPFHAALSDFDVKPRRAVHVGDSLASDVAGAHAAGVRSGWLADGREPEPEPEPHYMLESVADLATQPWRR